jgi:hypothetical protein
MLLVLRCYPIKTTVLYPKDDVAHSSKSLCVYKTTQHRISNDSNLKTHFCENLNHNKLQPQREQKLGPVKYETGMLTCKLQYSVRYRRSRNRKDCQIILVPTVKLLLTKKRTNCKEKLWAWQIPDNFYGFLYDGK